MPVLVTDTLTVLQCRSQPAFGRLVARLATLPPQVFVWVTIISFEEQMRGWLEYVKRGQPRELPARYAKLRELNEDFSTRPVLPFNNAAAVVYQELLRKRTGVGAMDLKIAAIALATDELLISANLRHFKKIPGLTVEDWTAP